MGTPTDEKWQGVQSLPGFASVNWTMFPAQDLKKDIRHMETLDEQGLDLLYKLLEYDPT